MEVPRSFTKRSAAETLLAMGTNRTALTAKGFDVSRIRLVCNRNKTTSRSPEQETLKNQLSQAKT